MRKLLPHRCQHQHEGRARLVRQNTTVAHSNGGQERRRETNATKAHEDKAEEKTLKDMDDVRHTTTKAQGDFNRKRNHQRYGQYRGKNNKGTQGCD